MPLLALLCAPAAAQDFRAWQGAHEGLLIDAAEGETARAITWYEGLIRGLPEDDPSQGLLHLNLGRSLYVAGDSVGARAALERAAQDDAVREQALALVLQIDAVERRVTSLPHEDDFSDGTGAWLKAWQHAGRGALETRPPPGSTDPALAWSTDVSERQEDSLTLGFSLGDAQPELIGLDLRAEAFPATLLLLVGDGRGRWASAGDLIVVPVGSRVRVEVPWDALAPMPAEGGAAPGLPEGLSVLELRDVTAFTSPDQGANVIYIDNVRVF